MGSYSNFFDIVIFAVKESKYLFIVMRCCFYLIDINVANDLSIDSPQVSGIDCGATQGSCYLFTHIHPGLYSLRTRRLIGIEISVKIWDGRQSVSGL